MRNRLLAALAAIFTAGGGAIGVTPAAAAPAAPVLTGTAVDTRAVLDWNAVSGAYDYLVVDVSRGEPGRIVAGTRNTEWTSPRLPLNQEAYDFQVFARDRSKAAGPRSNTVTVYPGGAPTQPEEPPAEPEPTVVPAPTGLTAVAQPDRRVVLDWDDVEGADAYRIYEPRTEGPVTEVTTSTRTSPALSPGDYFYSVSTVIDGVESERSAEVPVTVLPEGTPPPEEPEEPEEPTEPPVEEPTDPEPEPSTPVVRDEPVDLGAAVSLARLQDPVYRATVIKYFDSITAENEMKARLLQPQRGVFDYTNADRLVAFARENGKEIRGHTLFWHGANPSWLTNGNFSQAEWAQLIRDHATNVVGHFAGQIESWDVLNEIVAEDGSGLRTDNPWVNGFGGDPLDAIALMFEAAHEADPNARLCINDFSVEFNRPKTNAYYELVKTLRERGVPIDCVGFQSHLITESEGPGTSDPGGWSPTVGELTDILQRFADLGVTVQLTEADLKTSPTPGTTAQKLEAHADMARVLAQACQNVEACTELTWWGVPDSQSWLGANEMTLLFSDAVTDGTFTPKPAYWATREIIGGGPTTPEEPTEPPVEEPTDPEPEVPTAEPIRSWDVDPGDSVFDVWPEIHAPSHERVQVSTEQVFPGEDASLRFETRRSDPQGNPGANSTWNVGNTGTRRAEVRDSIAASGSPTEGTEQWWSWANYFPADFNWDERNQFFGFMQFHQTANSGNPPVHFWSDEQENIQLSVRGGTGGRTGGDAQYTEHFPLGPVEKGAWNEFIFHVVWSSNPNVGLVEVYRDGELVLSERAANLYSGQSAYVKQGIYSANGVAVPVHVIYTSTTRLGNSLESVRPRAEN